ncbi:MAG: ATP-binding cassette domain-containing protein, partial [Candidatus Limnocylindrales bacterium]
MSIVLEPRRSEPVPALAPDAARRIGHVSDDALEPVGQPLALRIDHVTKTFIVGRKKRHVTAVDDVTLGVERGGILGILGANGGGKSTLIRLISTLLTLDTGTITVFGHDVERDEMAVKRL